MTKALILAAATGLSVLLGGCATALLSAAPSTTTFTSTKSSKIVAEDQLYAVGRISNSELLAQYPSAVAMVGRNAVYVLVTGGDRFAEVTQKLDGSRLFSADRSGKKLTQEVPFEIAAKNGQFSGWRRFFYGKPKSELTPAEIETINKSGVSAIGDKGSTFIVDFTGFIPKAPVQLQGDQTSFKAERKIILRETQFQETTLPNLEKFMLIPLTVAFDIATLPFQALFFAVTLKP